MAKTISKASDRVRKGRPALTPEARENQLIALAMNAAEQQLLDGTASSQVITHFLKLGTIKEQLEMEKIRRENTLLDAKVEALKSSRHIEELMEQALMAMRDYSGNSNDDGDDEYDE